MTVNAADTTRYPVAIAFVDASGAPILVKPASPLPVTLAAAGDGGVNTATITSVNSGTSSVTLLAANTARYGATITNTDANPLLVCMSGGTASATNYSVKLSTDAYFEVPYGYTGLITGIWTGDGAGVALVTEYT